MRSGMSVLRMMQRDIRTTVRVGVEMRWALRVMRRMWLASGRGRSELISEGGCWLCGNECFGMDGSDIWELQCDVTMIELFYDCVIYPWVIFP